MKLHGISAVAATNEAGVYIVDTLITDGDGVTETVKYASQADDPYGLAPQVWAAVQEWIAAGKPVEAT